MRTLLSRGSETSRQDLVEDLKRRIHGKLVDKLDLSRVGALKGDSLKREIRGVVEHLCDAEETPLSRMERERIIDEVLDETLGLGPLEWLLKDPTVSDILVNGPKKVYVEKGGRLQKTNVEFRDNKHLLQIIDRIVSRVGRRVDETCPMVDARLEDGSRVNAIIPPLALDGAAMSIRRFGSNPLKLSDLLDFRAFTPEMVMLLEGCIKARLNMVIAGGTRADANSRQSGMAWRNRSAILLSEQVHCQPSGDLPWPGMQPRSLPPSPSSPSLANWTTLARQSIECICSGT